MNQCDKLMAHFQQYGHITALEAWDSYNIRRLASRISDLKKSGVKINKENKRHKVTGQKYVRYSTE